MPFSSVAIALRSVSKASRSLTRWRSAEISSASCFLDFLSSSGRASPGRASAEVLAASFLALRGRLSASNMNVPLRGQHNGGYGGEVLARVNSFAAVATVHFLSEVLACIAQQHEYPAKAVGGRGTHLAQGSETHSQAGQKSGHKVINLALQGGGSHGAFAWGALDRILEDQRIVIEGIVGASAGAMNAVVTAYGLTLGGNEGARRALRQFWEAVAELGARSVLKPSWFDRMKSPGSLDYSPGWILLDTLSRVLSPYQMNPVNYHPLREILSQQIDFAAVRQSDKVKLFICASNVLTNRLHVFEGRDMTIEAVLASAAYPSVFQATEINGEHYWDGGYMGNPPLFPISNQYAELQL